MRIKDKRFGIWEGMMLLCGLLSAWLYALNFGISLRLIPATVLCYVTSCLAGGSIAWLVHKGNSGWKRAGYTFLFATLAYGVIEAAIRVLFPNPYGDWQGLFADALLYWCLASLLPILLFSFLAKLFFRTGKSRKDENEIVGE